MQTFLAWCTWFTFGIALLVCRVPMLVPLGISFTLLGIAPFLSERVVARGFGMFILLLGLSLLYIIQSLRLRRDLPTEWPRPELWYAGALLCIWGIGILFGYRRWRAGRSQ